MRRKGKKAKQSLQPKRWSSHAGRGSWEKHFRDKSYLSYIWQIWLDSFSLVLIIHCKLCESYLFIFYRLRYNLVGKGRRKEECRKSEAGSRNGAEEGTYRWRWRLSAQTDTRFTSIPQSRCPATLKNSGVLLVKYSCFLKIQIVMMTTVKGLKATMKNSKWQKARKRKRREKWPRPWKPNRLLPPKKTNQPQKHQSQNPRPQVCCFTWKQFLIFFNFNLLQFIEGWTMCLSASSFHTSQKSPSSQTGTQETFPVLRRLRIQTSLGLEPVSKQGAQVDSTRFRLAKWHHQPIRSLLVKGHQWKEDWLVLLIFLCFPFSWFFRSSWPESHLIHSSSCQVSGSGSPTGTVPSGPG